MAASPDELDALHAHKSVEDPDEDTDTEDEDATIESLRTASELLKRSRVLFEFLADPDYCKNLTKRDRDAMLRRASEIDDFVEELDQTLEESEV